MIINKYILDIYIKWFTDDQHSFIYIYIYIYIYMKDSFERVHYSHEPTIKKLFYNLKCDEDKKKKEIAMGTKMSVIQYLKKLE